MLIYVCVKHVPDTAANIKIIGDNGFDDVGCKFIANPYDEYTGEQAVQLVEKHGGEVVVVTVGKDVDVFTIDGAAPGDTVEWSATVRTRAVPDECFRDKGLMSKWIDGNR